MSNTEYLNQSGTFEARYLAFLETITQLRPSLHRYCARMTGSVMDGEDVVQEALFEAYRKLEKFDDTRALKPWLFRIAHNRCIDFLRKRGVRLEADTGAVGPDLVESNESLALGEVDGVPTVIVFQSDANTWKPRAPVRIEVADQRIVRITDYFLCPWILEANTGRA